MAGLPVRGEVEHRLAVLVLQAVDRHAGRVDRHVRRQLLGGVRVELGADVAHQVGQPRAGELAPRGDGGQRPHVLVAEHAVLGKTSWKIGSSGTRDQSISSSSTYCDTRKGSTRERRRTVSSSCGCQAVSLGDPVQLGRAPGDVPWRVGVGGWATSAICLTAVGYNGRVDSPLRRAPAPARRARSAVAALGARTAARLSRLADFGDGTAIGGRVAMKLEPAAISVLSQDIPVALVSATNGKSTAATMLAAALSTAGPVAFNSGGSNMREGVAMALSQTRRATHAVLEVDEMVLGPIARETQARWVVLMNASREYTRGVSLERTLDHWATTLADPDLTFTVVANADDPVIAEMALPLRAAGRVVWVAGGMEWRRDSVLCARCGRRIEWPDEHGPDWACTGCDLARPGPTGSSPTACSTGRPARRCPSA